MLASEDPSPSPSSDPASTDDSANPAARSSATPELVVVGLVAVAIGVVTRFTTRSALWLDEALSVNIASLPLGDIAGQLKHDGHPPLYYWLLHVWMELFGQGDIAVRALAGVFGLLCLPMAWLIGRRRGGTTLAWLAVAVTSLAAFMVRYADETRMYSMVMAEVFVGWLLVDDLLRGRAGRFGWRWIALGLVAVAMPWTHYWTLWLLGAVGLCVLVRLWRSRRAGESAERRTSFGLLAVVAVAGVAFLPWVPTLLYQGAHTGTPWASPMRPTAALSVTLADFGSGNYGEQTLVAVIVGLAIVLGVFGYAIDRRRVGLALAGSPQFRLDAGIAALTFLIGSLVTFAMRSTYAARYGSVVMPFVVLLVAAGLTRFSARWVRFGVVVVVCGFLAMGAVWNVRSSRTQVASIAEVIGTTAVDGDVVVVCPDQLGPSTRRELSDDLVVVSYPDGGDGRFVDWVDYADRNGASDPVAFADAVLARSDGHAIYVVSNGSYRTFETKCDALLARFASVRPTEMIAADDGENFFEHAQAYRFGASTG